jgi:hypothetical protein
MERFLSYLKFYPSEKVAPSLTTTRSSRHRIDRIPNGPHPCGCFARASPPLGASALPHPPPPKDPTTPLAEGSFLTPIWNLKLYCPYWN